MFNRIVRFSNLCAHVSVRKFSWYNLYDVESLLLVKLASKYLISIHDSLNLNWTQTFFVSTLFLKTTLSTTCTTLQIKNTQKLTALQSELAEIVPLIKRDVSDSVKELSLDFKQAKSLYNLKLKNILRDIYTRDNCHPYKNYLYPLIQLPFWISVSVAIRCMTINPHSIQFGQLANESFLTACNLCTPDSSFIIPTLLLMTNLIAIQMTLPSNINTKVFSVNAIEKKDPKNVMPLSSGKILTLMKWGMRFSVFLMYYISCLAPSGLVLYWWFSAMMGLGINQGLRRFYARKRISALQ